MQVASTSFWFRLKSAAPAGLGRRLATALIFAAFLLQGFIAQTHMHTESGTIPYVTHIAGKVVGQAPALPGIPDETAKCPLCQAIIHAGSYFLPTVLDIPVQHRQDNSPPIMAARDLRTDYHGHREQPRGPPSI